MGIRCLKTVVSMDTPDTPSRTLLPESITSEGKVEERKRHSQTFMKINLPTLLPFRVCDAEL
jgi:hypothetical protein